MDKSPLNIVIYLDIDGDIGYKLQLPNCEKNPIPRKKMDQNTQKQWAKTGWNHIFGTFCDHTMGMLNIRGMGNMWRVNDWKLDMIYTYTWFVDGWMGVSNIETFPRGTIFLEIAPCKLDSSFKKEKLW